MGTADEDDDVVDESNIGAPTSISAETSPTRTHTYAVAIDSLGRSFVCSPVCSLYRIREAQENIKRFSIFKHFGGGDSVINMLSVRSFIRLTSSFPRIDIQDISFLFSRSFFT